MGLVEGVAGERLDEVVYLLRLLRAVPLGHRPLKEVLLLPGHHLPLLLAHRLAHDVRLAQGVPGELLGDEQHLVLVDDDPVRLVQDLGQVRVRVGDRVLPVLGVDVGGDVLDRPGTVEGDQRRQVLDGGGPHLLHRPPHAARLQLEHAEGVARGQHLVRPGVAVRQLREVDLHVVDLADHLYGQAEDGEVGQAQEVHLQQPQIGHVVHDVLGGGQGLLVPRRGPLQGEEVHQRLGGDDHTGGVGAGVAGHPLQGAGGIDELADLGIALVYLAQPRALLERPVDGHHAEGGRHGGHLPHHAVHVGVGHAQGAADVAEGGPGAQGAEGDDLGHAVVAVLLGGVADHLIAPVLGEVDVNVRHLPPLHVEEALEHQPVLQGVDLRHAQAVKDDGGRRRAADGHADAPGVGLLGEVIDHQDVLGEARLTDDLQLGLQPGQGLIGVLVIEACQPLAAEVCQVLLGGGARRHLGLGQAQVPELQREVAHLGDAPGVVAGLGELREQRPHLLLRLQVIAVGLPGHAQPLVVQH